MKMVSSFKSEDGKLYPTVIQACAADLVYALEDNKSDYELDTVVAQRMIDMRQRIRNIFDEYDKMSTERSKPL